jgi:hypothetical protein
MKEIYFHIGFHKTGTTWLQQKVFLNTDHFNLLNDHIKPWNDKLISYLVTSHPSDFQSDTLLQIIKPRIKKNKINIVSAERLSGHPYSAGFDTEAIAEKIYKTFPKAKIIIVSRDKKSFIYSSYKQLVKRGYPGNFTNYVNSHNWFFPTHTKFYFEHKNTINLYKDIFGTSNILNLEFQCFQKSKNEFLNSISRFLQIEISIEENDQSTFINKTYSNRRIRSIRFLNKFRKTEFNRFPLIELNKKTITILSRVFSYFYTNKKLNHDFS